jgi:predicted phosphodiesterase
MRVLALSDIHVDYDANARWVGNLSKDDYRDDLLILAGDVSHKPARLAWCLEQLAARVGRLLFVPGNHDLWVLGEPEERTSLQKFREVVDIAERSGASMQPYLSDALVVAPLLGWYDYSFGEPGEELLQLWMDYRACRWPDGFGPAEVARHFTGLNRSFVPPPAARVITFSHFMPRIDLLPARVSARHRVLDPILGSTAIEDQLRRLRPAIHVYGHSHINRSVEIDGVRYINNAFGYPREHAITARRMLCIDEI